MIKLQIFLGLSPLIWLRLQRALGLSYSIISSDSSELLSSQQQNYLDKESSLQKKLNELRTNLAQLEQSKRMRGKTVEENRQKIAAISRELASLGSGGAALEGVEQELRSAVSRVDVAGAGGVCVCGWQLYCVYRLY